VLSQVMRLVVAVVAVQVIGLPSGGVVARIDCW
jgi:hypothetical protein